MDSTMMWIVHQAMNNAHEKMQCREGVLERLNGISRFYELAVMQLEGCLKFVRQETDSYILESSHEQLLTELTEVRNRLQGRLKESEMAIMAKDRELASLHASNANLKRTKSEPVEEYILSNRVTGNDDDDGDGDDDGGSEFCELKNSVDQQVWNIRQKLEPDYKFKDKEGNPEVLEGVNNQRIEQMGSDMGILKETLDLAFGKMQNAIFKSEVGPMEQWRWSVEKDTMSILLKGFMRDFEEDVEVQVWRQEKQVCLGLKEFWYDLMNEVANFRHELDSFVGHGEVQVKSFDSLQTSLGCRVPIPNKTNEKHSVEDFSHGKLEKQRSLKAEEVMQDLHEEEKEAEGGHFVSKMIKNHESIIRKKSAEAEELNLLKREILHQKWNLSSRKEEIGVQENSLKRRVQEIILRVDKLRYWDAKLCETFGNSKFDHEEETFSENRFLKSDANPNENLEHDTLEDVWKKMDRVPYAVNEELQSAGRTLKQEEEEEELKSVIMEKTYVTLLEGIIKENNVELYDCELENLIWKDICNLLFTEVVNQWKENIESYNIESRTREEIYCTVLREAIKDYGSNGNIALVECQDLRAENNSLRDLALSEKLSYFESTVREDLCSTLLHELFKEWNECIDGYETGNLIRQEIDWLIFLETVEGIVETASDRLAKYRDIVTMEFLQSTESFVREDIYMVFIRQAIKEWEMELNAFKMESLIREEIYEFVIVEALKDAFGLLREEGKNLNEKIGVEEDLMLSAGSEMKEHNSRLDSVGLECEDYNEPDISKELLTKGHSLSAVSSKLASLGSQLGSARYRETSSCQPKLNKDVQLNPFDPVFTPVLKFSQILVDFEHTTKDMFEMNCLRLNRMKHHLDILVELVSSSRKKESLYRDAFIRRCQDLWKAETEVDLLGDQVDALVALVDKIYTKLHHNSRVLQQHFEVSDILQLIQKELTGVVKPPKN